MKKFLSLLTTFLLFFALFTAKALAANISVSLPATVVVGENFEVLINADSDGKLINSVDIILDYDQSLISFSGYKSDGAVIGLWVKSPHEENGNIYMSGIIPGGVLGLYDPNKKGLDAIPLVRLIFTAKKDGNAAFSFIKTEILEHDGAGTALPHEEIGGKVIIKKNSITLKNDDGSKPENIVDQEKPEPFEIIFLESSIFGRTPSMIIFKANDIGSGIKEYKINQGGSIWKDAQSPEAMGKGIFPRNITVRAFDFSGNFEDSSIRIPGLVPPQFFWLILSLLTIVCIMGYKMIKYKA